jgi:hypothetical protein
MRYRPPKKAPDLMEKYSPFTCARILVGLAKASPSGKVSSGSAVKKSFLQEEILPIKGIARIATVTIFNLYVFI